MKKKFTIYIITNCLLLHLKVVRKTLACKIITGFLECGNAYSILENSILHYSIRVSNQKNLAFSNQIDATKIPLNKTNFKLVIFT